MEQEELIALLKGVRVLDGYRRVYSHLSEQQISAVVLAVLPTVKKRIEQARAEK